MQKLFIVGHLGGCPEIKTTADGRENAYFSVACNVGDTCIWYTCVMPARNKVCEFMEKGKQVAVSGRFVPKMENGKVYFNIYVDDIMLTGKREGEIADE